MALHRIYLEDQPLATGAMIVGGDEAHHAARVKRVEVGEGVELLDGRGGVGRGAVAEIGKGDRGRWEVRVEVTEVRQTPPLSPRLEVLTAAPKGGRLEELIDGLSQVGAASWALLETQRGQVDPRPGKLERLGRTAAEASKQCGRAWHLQIGMGMNLGRVLDAGNVVVADSSGEPYTQGGKETIRLLVGPEGGWTREELETARGAGARVARFGAYAMRIETAAVAAAAIVLDVEGR